MVGFVVFNCFIAASPASWRLLPSSSSVQRSIHLL
jgi:hypothetical protein